MRYHYNFWLFLFSGAGLLCSAGYQSDIVFWKTLRASSGTLALFHFDTTETDKTAFLKDSSPDQAQTEVSGKVKEVAGKFGSGLEIEEGMLKVSLRRPVAFEFSWMSSAPQFSGEAWVYLKNYPEKEGVIFEFPFLPGKQNYWCLKIRNDGSVVMAWRRHEGEKKNMQVTTSPGVIPVGRWVHVAGLFRHGHHAAIYVNGEEKGTTLFLSRWAQNEAPAVEKEPAIFFLGNNEKNDSLFPGYLDEVRIATDIVYFFPQPDRSWCDPGKTRPLIIGKPYTPEKQDILLYVDAETPELISFSKKEKVTPIFNKKLPVTLTPGVRGTGFTGAVSFPQEGILQREKGALEFWFAPVDWSNGQSFHVGICGGPFTVYVLNTGVVRAPWVPVVAYFNDRSSFPFYGLFSPEKWQHLVVCWEGEEITTYINGEFSAKGKLSQGSFDQVAGRWPLSFNQYSSCNFFDEIFVYNRALSAQEVSNCYWRYRDLARLKPLLPVEAEISYIQGSNLLVFRLTRADKPVRSFSVEVKKENRSVYSGKTKTLSDKVWQTESLPPLLDGQYTAIIKFFEEKNSLLSSQSKSFAVKHFPWEKNTIGKEPIIIPPYLPLSMKGKEVCAWGRSLRFGETGFPESIISQNKEILARPINLVFTFKEGGIITLKGERLALKDIPGLKVVNSQDYLKAPLTGSVPPLELAKSPGYQVEVNSSGRAGPLKVEVRGQVDIDGWYQFQVTMKPADRPVTVEALDLEIPLLSEADTLYAQVLDRSLDPSGYVNSSGEFGAAPKKTGDSWNSLILKRNVRWKSFVPQVFLGTGEFGLWFLAESSAGWILHDEVPCVTVKRYPEEVRLTLKIIAAPTLISSPRSFECALLPVPVKPLPERWREIAWRRGKTNKNYYTHDTSGYRYWGDSVDSFSLPSEEDYRKLGDFLRDPVKINPYYNWYAGHYSHGIKDGVPHVLYGSTWMTGLGREEFTYFAQEWLGNENWKPLPDLTFEGVPNYGNTCRWVSPEQLTATGVNFNSSFVDFFIWCHQQLLKNCPVNGTWWDNSSIGFITEYLPGEGPVEIWNTFTRRDLTRRLAVMSYQATRRPWWLMNMHVDFSWCQVAWHIENDFYIQGKSKDLIDQLGIDKFRALTRTKGGIIPQLHSNMPENFSPEEQLVAARTIIGLCLLHDIGERGLPDYKAPFNKLLENTVDTMEKEIGFFSEEIVFLPYWRQKVMVLPENVYASFFTNRGKSVAVIVNAGEKGVDLSPCFIKTTSLGLGSLKQVSNLENKQIFPVTFSSQGVSVSGLSIPRHGLLLLLLQ